MRRRYTLRTLLVAVACCALVALLLREITLRRAPALVLVSKVPGAVFYIDDVELGASPVYLTSERLRALTGVDTKRDANALNLGAYDFGVLFRDRDSTGCDASLLWMRASQAGLAESETPFGRATSVRLSKETYWRIGYIGESMHYVFGAHKESEASLGVRIVSIEPGDGHRILNLAISTAEPRAAIEPITVEVWTISRMRPDIEPTINETTPRDWLREKSGRTCRMSVKVPRESVWIDVRLRAVDGQGELAHSGSVFVDGEDVKCK